MNKQVVAARIEELVASGKDLTEAILQAMNEGAPKGMSHEDRMANIPVMDNLEDIRIAMKIAFAKKSKEMSGKRKPEALDRYAKEIKAYQARANEIIATIHKSKDPIDTAIRFGESASGVIQLIILAKEPKLEDDIKAYKELKKLSNVQLKEVFLKTTSATPESFKKELEDVGEKYYTAYEERVKNQDQRVWKLNRSIRILES